MALNLSALTSYVEENADALLTKAVFGGKTISLLTPKPGIKSATKIGLLDTDAVFQAGGSCGFNSSGATTITQREIVVGKLKVQEELCPPDLEAYFTQKALPAGSNYDIIAFAKDYTDLKNAKINAALETAVWQSSTSASGLFDGLIKIIDAEGAVIESNTTSYISGAPLTSISDTNALEIVMGVFKAIPAAIIDKKDVVCFCGWDTFRHLIANITNNNLFHYVTDDAVQNGELIVPGTTLKVIAVHGLDSTHRLFAARTSNLFFGTDMISEEDKWTLKYDEINEVVKYSVKWKAGVQVAFPDQIVKFTLNTES
jgi:hypothetical protein